MKYSPKDIEQKWQRYWEDHKLNQVDLDKAKNPFYNLMMFPYSSAEGLHVGNTYAFVHSDAFGRFMRLKGFDVFEPIGLDGFGIHSENYAIKIGEHIKKVSQRTEKHFYEQLHAIGNQYDWSRKVETYKPEYYKWTQWLFLEMYKKGLAYRAQAPVNWCPSCKTVLSDEQIISGACERCGTQTEKRPMEQWFFKITDFAERLLKNLEKIDWPEDVKTIQRNWIGKSEGAEIKFVIASPASGGAKQSRSDTAVHEIAASSRSCGTPRNDDGAEVFTTRPDTIFGATFMVLCPEHELLEKLKDKIENWSEVEAYIKKAQQKSEMERADLKKEKTGVELKGIEAINPASQKAIPVFVADYVMVGYGSGAIMAVPAHDERDFEFAKKYGLLIDIVIVSPAPQLRGGAKQSRGSAVNNEIAASSRSCGTPRNDDGAEVFTGNGILMNSGEYNGLTSAEATEKIIAWLEKNKIGGRAVKFKLRDWCISRQRYWGPPIPIIYCEKCGIVPVPEKDLPVLLPEMKDFLPDGSGKGPLNKNKEFVNTVCPQCGGPAKRETDVSDPFVDSCWYYLRYTSTDFDNEPFDEKRLDKWLPVNMYIGGKEHAVLHLLYSRFVAMVLKDAGFIKEEEPFKKFFAHGLLIHDGAKMSKSKGNVVNPDEYIKKFGADSVRLYLMFLGDVRQGGDWRDTGINGMYRFVNRIWKLSQSVIASPAPQLRGGAKPASPAGGQSRGSAANDEIAASSRSCGTPRNDKNIEVLLNKTIKKVGDDLANLKFNTAISALMILVNEMEKQANITAAHYSKFLILLAPFAPHIAEELYSQLGNKKSIFTEPWPEHDKNLIKEETIELVVQINGKMRAKLSAPADISEAEAKKLALSDVAIQKWLGGQEPKKVIFVKGKLVNIVV